MFLDTAPSFKYTRQLHNVPLWFMQTSVLGTFFEVAGGPQAGSATNMAPGVPVMTQSTEFGPILGSGAGYMQSEYVFYRNWTVNHNFAQFDIGWFAAAGMAVQVRRRACRTENKGSCTLPGTAAAHAFLP
jgi:hypothetical protein